MIRVLLVDDSSSVRAVLRRFFARTGDIVVTGEACDGVQAVQAVLEQQPQVVVMDLQMPVMDGYMAIERIMELRPTPIIVLSSRANRNQMRTAFEAIRRGALEVLPKPEDTESWELLAASLPQMVRTVAGARPRPPGPQTPLSGTAGARASVPCGRSGASGGMEPAGSGTSAPATERTGPPEELAAGLAELRWVAIGASTGGPAALRELLSALPAAAPVSFLVVQHIAAGFEVGFAEWLNKELPFDVRLARDGEAPRRGAVRIAPAGSHLRLEPRGTLSLDPATPPRQGHRPSADELLLSCAASCPRAVAGVLLTGMGADGVEGLAALRDSGGVTLVQDEASCVVFGMPRVALERGAAQLALPPSDLARTLARLWRHEEPA
ncbi:MAG TPA: chemotaxis-specific protein-glutamate methyltransferase CheB [Thermoanaerobaculia bacterium]|nr:chemotaxis-specific protein-glutamate methyltransferase CheB [Thermoanaerobaculia bacterium]